MNLENFGGSSLKEKDVRICIKKWTWCRSVGS